MKPQNCYRTVAFISIRFSGHTGYQNPPLGQFLGQFKDELDGNDYIEEFVSGHKKYGYKTHQENVCCKVRGLSLNRDLHQRLNYEVIDGKQNVLAEVQEPLDQPRETSVPKTYQIERDAKKYDSHTFLSLINAWSTLSRSRPICMAIMIVNMERGTIYGTR